ncbi:MAG: hypothetical protein NVS4B7_04740 [Ktedonobacteraceae bacterium]
MIVAAEVAFAMLTSSRVREVSADPFLVMLSIAPTSALQDTNVLQADPRVIV